MYLTDLLPPEALIIGMLLAPRLDLAIATLEIVRIRRQPSLVALPLAFRPARRILAALLGLSCPWIRFVKPPAVNTPLLSTLCRFHTLILTDEVPQNLRARIPGNERNQIHRTWGIGIKGRINVGLVLIRIRSVLGIAYNGEVGHLFQGRYKAILCDKDAYLLELVRYIHLNPVRAKVVKKPDVIWQIILRGERRIFSE